MRRAAVVLTLMFLLAGCEGLSPTPRALPKDAANAAAHEVSLNARALPDAAAQSYRFLVVGHLYGSIEGEDTRPANALLGSLPAMEQMQLGMLVSLGDMVKQSKARDFTDLERLLLDELPFPVFNTVGNHDVEDRALYEQRYGQTFYSFTYGPARMIFLDTERQVCDIDDAQRQMLSQALQLALNDDSVQTIFIFQHRTLFFENEALAEVRNPAAGPNVWECYGAKGYPEIMRQMILPAAQRKPVYLFGGDVGAWGNLTPYYERRADVPLTLVMTGLGDTPQDAGILVSVDGPNVRLEAYPLAGQEMPPLETFNADYWQKAAQGK